MGRYLLIRLGSALPVLLLLSVLAFGLEALAPIDQARVLLEANGYSDPPLEQVEQKRAELGLDRPLPVRYFSWLSRAVTGDLGLSYRSYRPVADLYAAAFPATALLAAVAIVLAVSVGVPLGLLAAYHRGTWLDGLAQLLAVIGAAVPSFWLALVLVLLFSVTLRWLPAFGSLTPHGIVLPALVLAVSNIAVITRLTRAITLDTLGQEFITLARAKGIHERGVATGHVLPNVIPAVATQIGVELSGLLVGAAVVEVVFAWPGIGKLAVDSALLRDTPVVVGFAIAAGGVFILVNLLTDIVVATLDPRVRTV